MTIFQDRCFLNPSQLVNCKLVSRLYIPLLDTCAFVKQKSNRATAKLCEFAEYLASRDRGNPLLQDYDIWLLYFQKQLQGEGVEYPGFFKIDDHEPNWFVPYYVFRFGLERVVERFHKIEAGTTSYIDRTIEPAFNRTAQSPQLPILRRTA